FRGRRRARQFRSDLCAAEYSKNGSPSRRNRLSSPSGRLSLKGPYGLRKIQPANPTFLRAKQAFSLSARQLPPSKTQLFAVSCGRSPVEQGERTSAWGSLRSKTSCDLVDIG